MAFEFPAYHHPDFTQPALLNAPDARWEAAEKDGVAPEEYHSTSMYPEYFKINGKWTLAEESRMDSCVVLEDDGTLSVVESRNLKKGQRVMLGRTEHGEDGIYMHCNGFSQGLLLCCIVAQIAMISGESLLTPRRLLATMRSLRRPPGARSAM